MRGLYLRCAAAALVGVFIAHSSAFAGMSAGVRAGFSGYSAGEGFSENGLVFGAFAELPLPLPFDVRAGLDYWSKSYGEEPVTASLNDITIYGAGLYRLPLVGSPVTPYVGGQAGLHIFRSELDTPLEEPISSTDMYFGIHAIGGAEMAVSPLVGVVAEAKYGMIFSEGESTNVWALLGGAILRLPM
jgi:hypothetical protein